MIKKLIYANPGAVLFWIFAAMLLVFSLAVSFHCPPTGYWFANGKIYIQPGGP